MIDAIVFDMDGVLFDSEPVHMDSWRDALRRHGIKADALDFTPWIGVPDRDLSAHLDTAYPDPDGTTGRYLAGKREAFRRIASERLVPFAGLAEVLARCVAVWPLGVATSSRRDELALLLAKTGLAEHFRATCAYEDTEGHKPDPAPYRLAAERLGVAPERCAAVEDSPDGVAAARAAGMLTLGVTSSFDAGRLAAADRVFARTIDACGWLLRTHGAAADGEGGA